MQKPTIIPHGSTVTWKLGGTNRRYSTKNHDEAIALAAQLEQQWEDEQQARAASYRRLVDKGVDVVLVNPADQPAAAAPEPEPEPDPEPEPEPDPDVDVDVDLDWDADAERVNVTVTATQAITVWRSVGGRSSAYDIPADDPVSRTFKAEDGDYLELRLDGPDGELLTEHTFG